MKIFVKTLKGTHFEIQVKPEDTVADVKKNIESVQGQDIYPAAQQMLIHQGKVLKDTTTLEENKVAENSFVVIMLSKAPTAQPATSTSQARQTITAPQATTAAPPQSSPLPAPVSAPVPAAAPAPVPPPASSVTDVYDQAASNLVAGSNLDATVQQILDMGGGSWDRDTVVRALRAAYNNPERAVEYLYSTPKSFNPSNGSMVMKEQHSEKILILYASQTGNSIDAVERVGREAEHRGCPVFLLSLDDFDPSSLPDQEIVIFVVATTGQGDNPDSIKVFWKFLLQRNLMRDWLSGVSYAVFGLGDSSYQKYNFVAKKLDKRLSDLGATAIVERGLGDDQHPSGYEGALDPWMFALWKALYEKDPKLFPKGPEFVTSNMSLVDQPKVQITYHDVDEGASEFSSVPDIKLLERQIESTRFMLPGKLTGKQHPDCFLKMVKNDRLSKAGCGRDVYHFELEAVSSSIEYEVGDVVHILPGQDAAAVDAFIKRCNLNPESYIRVEPREKENDQSYDLRNTSKDPVKLRTFVELAMDVASASPRRYFFEVMSYFTAAKHEKERLQYFASPEGRDDLYEYNQKERRTVLEVLEDFPSVQMPFEWLVQLVPPLKTRAFSISSSHSAHPNQVHLTVSVVSWTTPYKRERTGLCSSWLAELDPQKSVLILAWFQKGSLPSPPPSLPLILVGPGTGCAPFRGFVEERARQSQSGPTAPVIFFFGCRNEDIDFLYRDFWSFHSQKDKVLSEEKGGGFFATFSRDQPQKVYVQHKMREQRVKVWNLLTEGAAVYVAGSANKMPCDVLLAFEEIVSKEGGVPKETAVKWLRALEKAGKYHVEAWS